MGKRTQRQNKDLADKIWLQQEALRSLSGDLLAAALIIDDSPPPRNRPWTIWHTPPIKGFDIKKYMSEDSSLDTLELGNIVDK